MADPTKAFFQALGKHFVSLSCTQRVPGSDKEKGLIFSGFVVEIDGVWFYITAGHILRGLQAAQAGGTTFDYWRFGDETAGNSFKGQGVPYYYRYEDWWVLEDKALGLDYAALPLRDLYVSNLQAGGVVPITKSAWGTHLEKADQWAVIGVPSESVDDSVEGELTARYVGVILEPADAPQTAGTREENQFYARRSDIPQVLNDMDGLSGGPVFAMAKVDGKRRYKVIGVQSAVYSPTDIIAACPFANFGAALEHIVKEVRERQRLAEAEAA